MSASGQLGWCATAMLLLAPSLASAAPPPPMATPPWTSTVSGVRSGGLELSLLPLRGAVAGPDPLVSGVAALQWPLGIGLTLGLRAPFLARPAYPGNPSLALGWTFYRRRARARAALVTWLRVFAPVAPETGDEGRAAAHLRQLVPRWAAAWLPGLTIGPGLGGFVATTRYAVHFGASIEATATGPTASQVALAYVLGFNFRVAAGLALGGEVGGRVVTDGGGASNVGVALLLGYRSAHHAPTLRVRFPLGDAVARSWVVVELGWGFRF